MKRPITRHGKHCVGKPQAGCMGTPGLTVQCRHCAEQRWFGSRPPSRMAWMRARRWLLAHAENCKPRIVFSGPTVR